MKRTPRISAIGTMMLLSPHFNLQWRIECFSVAGNWQGYTVCESKTDAIKHRRKLLRLHASLAKARRNPIQYRENIREAKLLWDKERNGQ